MEPSSTEEATIASPSMQEGSIASPSTEEAIITSPGVEAGTNTSHRMEAGCITSPMLAGLLEAVEQNKQATHQLTVAFEQLRSTIEQFVNNHRLYCPAAATPSVPKKPIFLKRTIASKEKLIMVDRSLGTPDSFNQTKLWLRSRMKPGKTIRQELHHMLRLLFSPKFLLKCSWNGVGKFKPKVPFKTQTNVLQLLIAVLERGGRTVDISYIKRVVSAKLLNAKIRLTEKK
ncbi:uncharacterized protein LOC131258864 [Anopheles coustani]|uniref:uncharacterized protein LOC131258864 n=1 Tax=Anopheles coustani TaxID=139045 RepID=UPI00265A7CDA|nr:uncharacterized protein LOC131258864 [Anopheles coustani]